MSEFEDDDAFSALTARLDTESGDAWLVHERAQEMKKRGEDVVMLSIGDPDFRTPDPIVDNAVSHLRVGRTHYSPALGEINLRRAVADYETRTSPHRCSADEVSIFPGVTAALYAVLSCLVDAGDEVVVVEPMYVGYQPILNALDATATVVRARSADGFEPRLDDMMAAVGASTRVMLVNTPGNPTGAMIPPATLARLAEHCRSRGIWLVCDEVYSMFTFDKPHISLRTAADRLDNVVVIDGLSKSHAMSGWRIGWVVAPRALTRRLGQFAAMSMFGCPQFIQDAAAFALNNDEFYVREMRNAYRKRRDLVCDRLDSIQGVRALRPDSGMFVMVDISALHTDDVEFARELLDAEKVSLLPGSAFGESTRLHLRLSLAQGEDELIRGCERIERFVSSR